MCSRPSASNGLRGGSRSKSGSPHENRQPLRKSPRFKLAETLPTQQDDFSKRPNPLISG